MRKALFMLLVGALMMSISSCGNMSCGEIRLKQGTYYNADKPDRMMQEYITIDPLIDSDAQTWGTSGSIVMNMAFKGSYQQKGSTITAVSYDNAIKLELQILSDCSFEVISSECSVNIAFWINEGDTFVNIECADPEYLLTLPCSADEALRLSYETDTVVIEDLRCTSGEDVWNEFYNRVSNGRRASVLCAHYYTIDREHMSEELYEEEKDQYPKLYLYQLDFDGRQYSVRIRDSAGKEYESKEIYRYLIHCTGEAPAQAAISSYDYYVLVDDDTLTWEEIERGMYSSQWGDFIRHCRMYSNVS